MGTTKNEKTLYLQQRTILEDVLDQKRKGFEAKFLTCPDKNKVAFLEKNKIVVLSDKFSIIGAILACLACILFTGGILLSGYSYSLAISLATAGTLFGAGFITVSDNHFIKSKLCSPWLKGKKSKQLMEKMFLASVVDEEVLRSFVRVYGEKKLLNILTEKDTLTYEEVFEIINRANMLKEKEINLTKAVICLTQ